MEQLNDERLKRWLGGAWMPVFVIGVGFACSAASLASGSLAWVGRVAIANIIIGAVLLFGGLEAKPAKDGMVISGLLLFFFGLCAMMLVPILAHWSAVQFVRPP